MTLWQNEQAIDVEMIEMTSPANFESRARLAPSGTRAVISAFDFAISLAREVPWPVESFSYSSRLTSPGSVSAFD